MAIHKVLVKADSEPASYKKQFRRALMTGGAVVGLDESLSESEVELLLVRFGEDKTANGVCELVVKALLSRESIK